MNARAFGSSLAGLAGALCLVAGGVLASCQATDPGEPRQILKLSLDDSLKRYDAVTIVLVDYTDTSKVLQTVWSGPLFRPDAVPPCTLTTAKNRPFAVKITAVAMNKTALITLIYYKEGQKTVFSVPLPPVVPDKWLQRISPSEGAMTPGFKTDTLLYRLSLPDGANKVTLSATPIYQSAAIRIDGVDSRSKEITVGKDLDTIPIEVTLLGVTRTYQVIIIPHRPVPLQLASIQPLDSNFFEPEFDTSITEYLVHLRPGIDTASLLFTPADPATMSMIVTENNQQMRLQLGNAYVAHVPNPGEEHDFTVTVTRGSESKVYDIDLLPP